MTSFCTKEFSVLCSRLIPACFFYTSIFFFSFFPSYPRCLSCLISHLCPPFFSLFLIFPLITSSPSSFILYSFPLRTATPLPVFYCSPSFPYCTTALLFLFFFLCPIVAPLSFTRSLPLVPHLPSFILPVMLARSFFPSVSVTLLFFSTILFLSLSHSLPAPLYLTLCKRIQWSVYFFFS